MIPIDNKIKSSKAKLGEKINCSLEVLSPIHIGSGVKLAEGIDFIKTNQSVQIISQAELMKYLEENHDEMEMFIKGNCKLNSLRMLPQGKFYSLNTGGMREIIEFERNGNGTPYIPGSSIKGAFRTVVLKKMIDGLDNSKRNELLKLVTSGNKEWASEPIIERLLGDKSNNNLMRVLEIFDAEFDSIVLEKVYILTLRNQNGTAYGWKKMGRDIPSQDDPKQATPIFIEMLPVGSTGFFSLSINSFLIKDTTAQRVLGFNEPCLSDIQQLRKTVNSYSAQHLSKEKLFFSNLNYSKKLNPVISEIDRLITIIGKLNNDEMVLRISWGSGWKGMTGDYLSTEWLSRFREKYGRNRGMGKTGFTIFPKTRRIVFEDNVPKYLTGWVKIKLNVKKELNKSDIVKTESIDSLELLKEKFNVTEWRKK